MTNIVRGTKDPGYRVCKFLIDGKLRTATKKHCVLEIPFKLPQKLGVTSQTQRMDPGPPGCGKNVSFVGRKINLFY